MSEETRNPRKSVPRAIIGSVVVAGLFYLIITYATSIGFGVRQAAHDWPASVAGLAAVAPNNVFSAIVFAAASIASLFCSLGVHTAVSRVLFAMGRERVLPSWLGRLHPRWNTPWRAISVGLAIWIVLAIASLLLNPARITFGSDFPYANSDMSAYFTQQLDTYPLEDQQRTAINYRNAQALFPRL